MRTAKKEDDAMRVELKRMGEEALAKGFDYRKREYDTGARW